MDEISFFRAGCNCLRRTNRRHSHSGCELLYVTSGRCLLLFPGGVELAGKEGDVFLGISTSGNSKNVLYAAVTAKAKGLKVIGLLGRDGGRIRGYSDTAIVVPEQETFKIQELHLPVYHALCLMLEEYFF